MQVDADGQKWMDVEESGCRWTQVDKIGCMWMKVDAGGPEYDVRVQRIPGTVFFLHFCWWYRNRYWKKMVPDKVLQPVSEKISTGKSLGTDIGKTWYRKKVSEPVSVKFGTGADFCCQNFGI